MSGYWRLGEGECLTIKRQDELIFWGEGVILCPDCDGSYSVHFVKTHCTLKEEIISLYVNNKNIQRKTVASPVNASCTTETGFNIIRYSSQSGLGNLGFCFKKKKLTSATLFLTRKFDPETSKSFQKLSFSHVVLSISIKA